MIKFKQKIYFLPALGAIANGVMIGGTALSLKQGADQSREMKEQAEAQEEQNEEITAALNRIAKQAEKNPQAAAQAAEVMKQKQYANIGSVLKNVGGFVKDLGKVAWKEKRRNAVIGGVLGGASLAGGSYLADRYVQNDMKKSGIPLPTPSQPQNQSINNSQKQFTFLGTVGKTAVNVCKQVKNAASKNKSLMLTMSAMGAVPVLAGYSANKKQMQDQIANTNTNPSMTTDQRSYSMLGSALKSGVNYMKNSKLGKGAVNFASAMKNHPGESVLGWISNNIAFMGGRKGAHNLGVDLANQGVKSGNPISKKVGDFIQTHPKTTMLGLIPIGLGVTSQTWGAGENLTKSALKKVDNNGYSYQDSQNQIVQ